MCLFMRQFLFFVLLITIISIQVKNAKAIDICDELTKNNNKFDFEADDIPTNRRLFIGNNSWNVFYDNKSSLLQLGANVSQYQFPKTPEMSLIFIDENNDYWIAFYRSDSSMMETIKLSNPEFGNIQNIWFNTNSFIPSVAFGPLSNSSSDPKIYSKIFVINQTYSVSIPGWARGVRVYEYVKTKLEDTTDWNKKIIPEFIQKLDPNIYINAIFPFSEYNKYAVIIKSTSGSMACFTSRDMNSNECNQKLDYLIDCSIPSITSSTSTQSITESTTERTIQSTAKTTTKTTTKSSTTPSPTTKSTTPSPTTTSNAIETTGTTIWTSVATIEQMIPTIHSTLIPIDQLFPFYIIMASTLLVIILILITIFVIYVYRKHYRKEPSVRDVGEEPTPGS